jgi:ACS family glucarate transporter-like MFS transporter
MADQPINLPEVQTNRWYVLILAAVTSAFVLSAPIMCMPVLFKEISQELGLSLVQVGTIWGMLSLGGLTILIIGGMLGDRFGLERIIPLAIFFTGVAGAFRGLSYDFISLVATVFAFGILNAVLMINIMKVTKVWFSGRQFALANGVLATGISFGFSVGAMISATVLSPWLGGWRNVFFLYGIVSVVLSVLWYFTVREPGREQLSNVPVTVPMRQSILHVSRLRDVWLLGVAFLGYMGCIQGVTGYLSLYLQNIGWPAANADGALAAFNIAGAFGAIPIALLSDRLGVRKAVLISLLIMCIVSVILLPFFDNELVWILAILIGFTRDPCLTLLFVMSMEVKEVNVVYAGTAMGLMNTIGRIGASGAPALGNSLAYISIGTPFIFWATLVVMSVVVLGFIKETGWRHS